MSSNLELLFLEVKDLGWFYIQESHFCPKGAFDWMEHDPLVGGPYETEDGAHKAQYREGSSCGGSSTDSTTIEELIAGGGSLRDAIEDALGKELEMPPLPEAPVDVSAVLLRERMGRTGFDSGIFETLACAPSGVMMARLHSWRDDSKTHGFMKVTAMRDAAGIVSEVEAYGDGFSDADVKAIQERMAYRAQVIYPGELFIGKHAVRHPKPEIEDVYHVTGRDCIGSWGSERETIIQDGLKAGSCFCSADLVNYYAETIQDEGRDPVVIKLPLYKALAAGAAPDGDTIAEPITGPLGKSEEALREEYAGRSGTAIDCLEVYGALRCSENIFIHEGMIEDHRIEDPEDTPTL